MTAITPVVLVPGLLCDALMWAPQVEGLADVADIWVADNTRHDSIAGMAKAALEACPFENFSLAGLSMGGYVALEIWRQAPHRITRLALLDTNPMADSPKATASRNVLMDTARERTLVPVVEALVPRLIWPQAARRESLAAVIRTMARNTGIDAFIRQETAIIGRHDMSGELSRVECPTLVLCGADDILTPPSLHELMAERIPGATLRKIGDCGHLSTLEQPEHVNEALRSWLATPTA